MSGGARVGAGGAEIIIEPPLPARCWVWAGTRCKTIDVPPAVRAGDATTGVADEIRGIRGAILRVATDGTETGAAEGAGPPYGTLTKTDLRGGPVKPVTRVLPPPAFAVPGAAMNLSIEFSYHLYQIDAITANITSKPVKTMPVTQAYVL